MCKGSKAWGYLVHLGMGVKRRRWVCPGNAGGLVESTLDAHMAGRKQERQEVWEGTVLSCRRSQRAPSGQGLGVGKRPQRTVCRWEECGG